MAESTPSLTPSGPAPRVEPSILDLWPKSVQQSLCLLLVASVLILIGYVLGRNGPPPVFPGQGQVTLSPMDLNQATAAELHALPGIGETLAQRIVQQRERKGPFTRVDELRQVPGIGAITLERIRPFVFVRTTGIPALSPPDAKLTFTSLGYSKKEAGLGGQTIHLNRANADQLQKLPGIGPKLSQRILDYRAEKKGFQSVEELRKVSGIGPKIFERLKPYVTVDDSTEIVQSAGE